MSRRRGCRGCFKFILVVVVLLILAGLFLSHNGLEKVEAWFFPRDYETQVREVCDDYGLDPWLIMALIREESRFDADAVSHAGAVGLMQLMPETAQWIVDKAGFDYAIPDDLTDPAANIAIGVWYVDWLASTYYNDDLPAAIAAYNAGHGTVDGWLQAGVWDGSFADLSAIPYHETRSYLQQVYRSYNWYQRLYD